MRNEFARILAVGPQKDFQRVLGTLEQSGLYSVDYAADLDGARSYLGQHVPTAILLIVPDRERITEELLSWIEGVTDLAPLLVLSPVDDPDFYLSVMDHGAFDFFTRYSSFEEIARQLRNAVACHISPAA